MCGIESGYRVVAAAPLHTKNQTKQCIRSKCATLSSGGETVRELPVETSK